MNRRDGRHAGDAWFHVMDAHASDHLRSVFSENVELQTSMLNERLLGSQAVSAFFDVFTDLCETLHIQDEAESFRTTYLAWDGVAFSGRPFTGVTSMMRDEDGKISDIKVLCAPFSMLLRFSAAISPRLEPYLPGEN
jgi:hypothetical protein